MKRRKRHISDKEFARAYNRARQIPAYSHIVQSSRPKKRNKPVHKTDLPCPSCGEADNDNIIRLRDSFYECRTCHSTFTSDQRRTDEDY